MTTFKLNKVIIYFQLFSYLKFEVYFFIQIKKIYKLVSIFFNITAYP